MQLFEDDEEKLSLGDILLPFVPGDDGKHVGVSHFPFAQRKVRV